MNDLKDHLKREVSAKIDELEDLLEQVLPLADKYHREEILDILSLVRYRSEQYIREFGIVVDGEVVK